MTVSARDFLAVPQRDGQLLDLGDDQPRVAARAIDDRRLHVLAEDGIALQPLHHDALLHAAASQLDRHAEGDVLEAVFALHKRRGWNDQFLVFQNRFGHLNTRHRRGVISRTSFEQ